MSTEHDTTTDPRQAEFLRTAEPDKDAWKRPPSPRSEPVRPATLTARDVEVLRIIAGHGAMRRDHLRILLGRLSEDRTQHPHTGTVHEPGQPISDSRLSDIVRKWKAAGLVETGTLRVGQPGWVWMSRSGLHAVAESRPLGYVLPAHGQLAHTHAVNAVRLWAEDQAGVTEVVPDRVVRSQRASEGLDAAERGALDVPDLLVRWGEGEPVAVEVELSAKTAERLRQVLTHRANNYPAGCVYYCTPETGRLVARHLPTVEAALPESHRGRIRLRELSRIKYSDLTDQLPRDRRQPRQAAA